MRRSTINISVLKEARESLASMLDILGLLAEESFEDKESDSFIELLVDVRSKLRQEKRFDLSDYIRDRLRENKVELKDQADGTTRWRRASKTP